jgi:hypothetical protein
VTGSGTDHRYVCTKDIQAAVKGRETDILDKLRIPWREGNPHIRCPYRDHTDNNPSWRWDEPKRRAVCTCGSHSILDVLGKVEGNAFDMVKIRAAEILGRRDLIRVQARSKHYQRHDPHSLLDPPGDNRDDELPFIYLGARLEMEPADVPRPATPVVGIKSLEYFDRPTSPRAIPKLIGSQPCAVFGTTAADGRMHAHRIYLHLDGRAKADLGIEPNGRRRDPKKSARLPEGAPGIEGCAVIWGNPEKARVLVLFEGIENAAAGAHALRSEIEAEESYVASAITAGGVEAFVPYPVTELVTIGADRDEAKEGAGYRRGERAARTFAVRNSHRVEVRIGLPGAPGESTDWLEILLRCGVKAVRSGLLGAIPFAPTRDEIEKSGQEITQAQYAKVIAETYPLPPLETLRLEYRPISSGEIRVHKFGGEKTDVASGEKVAVWTPVSSPFGVPARLRYVDQADAYGLRCAVQDMNGQPRRIDLDRGGLAKMGAADIRSMLFAAGLRTEADGETIAVQCLKAAKPVLEILVVRRPGWHRIIGCPDAIFVAPNGAVFGVPDGLGLELATAVCMPPDVAEAGNLDGWRAAVASAISVARCEHWTLGVLGAFAGPIVALTGLDTCGINLSGLTTSEKSTAQRLAGSAWSTPDIRRPGLFQSARATDNAVEALAQRAAGTVLLLDEFAHVNGKAVAKMIYTIAGNTGKQRMTADASLRDAYTWVTFAILSGECSLEEKVRGDGGAWLAGMAVRIIDIDVTGVDRQVDAATLQSINDIDHHYGHAGPMFVRTIIERGLHRQAPALRARILKAARALAGVDTDSAIVRAAMPLALLIIAGELAKSFGLIPGTTAVKEAVRWAWDRFRQSSDAAALDPETQIIANLRIWVAERWGVTIKNVDVESGINNRETVAWFDDNAVYIPKGTLREASGNNLRGSEAAAILGRRGLLAKRTEADRLYVRFVPKVGRVEAYALSRSHFGRCSDATDPDTVPTVVHQVAEMADLLTLLDAAIDELHTTAGSRCSRLHCNTHRQTGTDNDLRNKAVPVVPAIPAQKREICGSFITSADTEYRQSRERRARVSSRNNGNNGNNGNRRSFLRVSSPQRKRREWERMGTRNTRSRCNRKPCADPAGRCIGDLGRRRKRTRRYCRALQCRPTRLGRGLRPAAFRPPARRCAAAALANLYR